MGILGGVLLDAPFAAEGQTPGRVFKVGILSAVNPRTTTFTEAMVQRLRDNDVHAPADQICGEVGKLIVVSLLRPSVFERDVPAFDVTEVAQAASQCLHSPGGLGRWGASEEQTDSPNPPGPLRLGGERRGEEGTSHRADEGSPVHHSIT